MPARVTLSRLLGLLACLSLVLSLPAMPVAAQAPAPSPVSRPLPLVPVPEAMAAWFGDGVSAAAFVQRAGYVPHALRSAPGDERLVIVRLAGDPAATVYAAMASAATLGGGAPPAQSALAGYRQSLASAQSSVMSQAAALGAREVSRYDTVYNGIQMLVPAAQLPALAALPGVVEVRAAPLHTPALAESAALIGARALGVDRGLYGEGLTIGIIDTGVDYTHAALGGSGILAAYANNDPAVREPGSFPTAKVIGGYDLAGSDYDAGGVHGSPIPAPDPDPLDEYGHGTHVASIAAGIAAGDVAAGVAPAARVIAYKVFGRAGSTALVMDALEMATEHYLVFGYPQILNLSLGSPFGAAEPGAAEDSGSPDVVATEAAAAAGIVVVASAGNFGDHAYIIASPGVADGAISVAATSMMDGILGDSARGPRGYDSVLKPDVAAPGEEILAAAMGTGTGGVSQSGTSAAAPHVAGTAALVLEAHPAWTPGQVKAAIMNTAADLSDDAPLPRAGAGRVDAYAAATSDALAVADRLRVSLNWGAVYSNAAALTLEGTVTISNEGAVPVTYATGAALQSGSLSAGVHQLAVNPAQVTVAAGAAESVAVSLTLDMTLVPDVDGLHEEYYGHVTLEPAAPAQTLRVPFYLAPRPYAALQIVAEDTLQTPLSGRAIITATLTGPLETALWAYPALVARTSPPAGIAPQASIRLFGMDSIGPYGTEGDVLAVAINSWAPWPAPQPCFAEFDLYLDPDDDGSWDYVYFNVNEGWFTGSQNNRWVVARYDLDTGAISLGSPWLLYNDYNSALMEWYLPVSMLGLGPHDSDLGYMLVGFDAQGRSDVTPPGRMDYLQPSLTWTYSGHPTSEQPTALLTMQPGSPQAYLLARPAGLMIVNYQGDPTLTDGAQAYLAPLRVLYPHIFWLPFAARRGVG